MLGRKQLYPDEKLLILLIKNIFWLVQYATGYYTGPVTLPSVDAESVKQNTLKLPKLCFFFEQKKNGRFIQGGLLHHRESCNFQQSHVIDSPTMHLNVGN